MWIQLDEEESIPCRYVLSHDRQSLVDSPAGRLWVDERGCTLGGECLWERVGCAGVSGT